MSLKPSNQTNLYGLDFYFQDFINLFNKNKLPNKILLSGYKGIGKSTLAYHLINYVLSKDEDYSYDFKNNKINSENKSYKLIQNSSHPNFILIDIMSEKKNIDIAQIRNMITNLNKSSFNSKPRFILIDNIEFLNINSINALLKILEEPNQNTYFILIKNDKKTLSTLSSRCINYMIYLTHEESKQIADKLLNGKLEEFLNDDLLNYYSTPGNIYNLVKFAENNKFDLKNIDLKTFLKIIIKENYYKKDFILKILLFDLIEFYFRKINSSFSIDLMNKYSYFLKRISDTKKYNLDEEALFIEFTKEILDG